MYQDANGHKLANWDPLKVVPVDIPSKSVMRTGLGFNSVTKPTSWVGTGTRTIDDATGYLTRGYSRLTHITGLASVACNRGANIRQFNCSRYDTLADAVTGLSIAWASDPVFYQFSSLSGSSIDPIELEYSIDYQLSSSPLDGGYSGFFFTQEVYRSVSDQCVISNDSMTCPNRSLIASFAESITVSGGDTASGSLINQNPIIIPVETGYIYEFSSYLGVEDYVPVPAPLPIATLWAMAHYRRKLKRLRYRK